MLAGGGAFVPAAPHLPLGCPLPKSGGVRAPDGSSPGPRSPGRFSRTPERGPQSQLARPHHPPGPTHGAWGPRLKALGSTCWVSGRPRGLQRMSPPRTLTDQLQDTTWGPAT